MNDRAGEVYEWALDDDILVVLGWTVTVDRKGTRKAGWKMRSLLDLRVHYFSESWFSAERKHYLSRVA